MSKRLAATAGGAGRIAGRAKVPLLAGGAALMGAAGLASGVALGGARAGEKVLGIRVPGRRRMQLRSSDLADTAKEIGAFGAELGSLAAELRRAREAASPAAARRSPIEVVLQGLTTRG